MLLKVFDTKGYILMRNTCPRLTLKVPQSMCVILLKTKEKVIKLLPAKD